MYAWLNVCPLHRTPLDHSHFDPYPRSLIGGVLPNASQTDVESPPSDSCRLNVVRLNRSHILHVESASCYASSLPKWCQLYSIRQQIERAVSYLCFFPNRQTSRRGMSILPQQFLSWYHGSIDLLRFGQDHFRSLYWCKVSCWLDTKDPPIEPVSFGLGETCRIRSIGHVCMLIHPPRVPSAC